MTLKISISCKCGGRYAVDSQFAGRKVQCRACGEIHQVPAIPNGPLPEGYLRCTFCHKYVLKNEYEIHRQQHVALRADGQLNCYATLPPEQRQLPGVDFANAPKYYRHFECGGVTGMPDEIIQTYLKNPYFYYSDRTFCTKCESHFHNRQFVWEESGENVHSYMLRLRAAKPEYKPSLLKRLSWMFTR